jgi:hypothetical protein
MWFEVGEDKDLALGYVFCPLLDFGQSHHQLARFVADGTKAGQQ